MTAVLSIIASCLKLFLELLDMKSAADKRGEVFQASEKDLYTAAKSLLERAQKESKSESDKAKKIDEVMDDDLYKNKIHSKE